MNLLLSIITSLVIVFSPQTSEAPQTNLVETSIEVGADGCPIEEPCWDYEAEDEVVSPEEARAWAAYESLGFPSSHTTSTSQDEYAATFEGEAQNFPSDYWTLKDPSNPTLTHVFHVIALTQA